MKKFWSKNKKNVWFWLTIIIALLFVRVGFESSSYMDKNTAQAKQIKKLKKQNKALTTLVNGIAGMDSSESEDETKESTDKSLKFGESATVSKGDAVATLTIDSVQKVDPNESMVTDISHNYDGLSQYVIINYTVNSKQGSFDTFDFDGSELGITDAAETTGISSSNRDPGTPDTLSEGQTAKLRIGYGLRDSGDTINISFAGNKWQGTIQ